MLNRFKNALYGNSSSSDDTNISSVYTDYKEAVLGKRIRGALTRSSSFREDLLNEVSKSRVDGSTSRGSGEQAPLASKLQRGRSQLLRKSSTIYEGDEQYSENSASNQTATNTGTTSTSTEPKSTASTATSASLFANDKRQSNNKHKAGPPGSFINKIQKFRYTRPEFLQLKTDDEIIVSADHQIRPIILPRDVSRLPWKTGYAECINAGKSATNEDQAACYQDVAMRRSAILNGASLDGANSILDQIPWTYFGLFDGHAGSAVAVAAAAQLHNIISEKLRHVADLLIALEFDLDETTDSSSLNSSTSTTNGFHEDNDDDSFEDSQSSPKIARAAAAAAAAPRPSSPLDDDFDDCVEDDDVKAPRTKRVDIDVACRPAPCRHLSSVATELEPVLSSAADADNTEETSSANDPPPASSSDSGKALNGTNLERQREAEERPAEAALASGEPGEKAGPTTSTDKSGEIKRAPQRQQDPLGYRSYKANDSYLPYMFDIQRNNITVESLIKGALESSFWEMDELIARDKLDYKMPGGCAVIVSLFIMGKLYVCNAGDCRAIVYKDKKVIPMSFDFTPVSERQRILRLGMQRPDLLGKEFTHLEFIRRPTRKDLGKHMYYRDAYMTGWSLKEVTYDDLKFPLVWGEGKRSRVLATIGVTRGFGDHELRAQYGSVLIKPFLTPEPEVRVLDLETTDGEKEHTDAGGPLTSQDVLIMGTDGLWDVASNEEVAEIVERSLTPDNELSRSKYRYISAAQDLIIHSRGAHSSDWNNNAWRMSGNDNKFASLDDISAFVIPLKAYRDEYLAWKRLRREMIESRRAKRLERHRKTMERERQRRKAERQARRRDESAEAPKPAEDEFAKSL